MRQLLAGLSWCMVLVYPFIVLFGLQLLPMRQLGLMLVVLAGMRILMLRSQWSSGGLSLLLPILLLLLIILLLVLLHHSTAIPTSCRRIMKPDESVTRRTVPT